MSLTTIYARDSNGTLIPVQVDLAGDAKDIGERVKAAIASHEDEDLTPTSYAFPPLATASTPPLTGGASVERAGVAPGDRDGTLIPSINDVEKINNQEVRRSVVRTWLSTSDVGDPEPRSDQDTKGAPSVREEEQPTVRSGPQYIDLEKVASASHVKQPAGEEDGRGEFTGSQTSLLTPQATPPATSDGEVREITEEEPFHSAYEMAHEAREPPADQSSERQKPKRLDSTSMANAMTYHRRAAEWDNKSITATVGSRKTIESIYDGSSIKDLSLSEDRSRERGATLTDKIMSLMPRRSSSKLSHKKRDSSPTDSPAEDTAIESRQKRAASTSSLMPPEIDSTFGYQNQASTDTNGYLTTNGRRASEIPETSSVTSPLNRLRRSFSKGEKRKSVTENASTPHIVNMMRKEGGPPVSTALVSPLHEHGGFDDSGLEPAVDEEDEEDEDDEYEGDSDSNGKRRVKGSHEDLSIQTIPITPNYDGFKDHALDLNPQMAPFLADRVAQEQVRRFKELKGHKIRHVHDVYRKQCASGPLCLALGGKPAYLPARSSNKGEKTQVFLIKGHLDIDEPGATSTNFQPGIPEPPVSQLPATFECSLCFKERKAVNKPSDWTKHVHEDLQPFTCTFRMCSTEKKSFKRKADWVRHENECHRHLDEWRCNYAECQHVCYRSDNFSQHLIREHKVPDFKNKNRGSISSKIRAQPTAQYGQEEELIAKLHRICRSANTARPDSEPCAFCGLISPTWKKHQVHLSKHMETIALPVLALIAREEVSRDTTNSPIKREPYQPFMGSNTISDVISTTDPNSLTPYSTNGSSLHQGSSASQSPLGLPSGPPVQAQLHSYSMGPNPFHPSLLAAQSQMGAPLFAQQQTTSPMSSGTYGPLSYGPSQMGYLDMDAYPHNEASAQRDTAGLYEGHAQLQSFTAVNSTTASTYPPPNLRRSPAQSQLQPPTSYPVSDHMSVHDYASSPHSARSYQNSTTPSPHQVRVSPMNHHLEIPRSQAMSNQMLPYSNGDYATTYAFTEQPAPYSSPLEAELYSHDFSPSIEAQDFLAATAALNYEAMTATSIPMENAVYDQQQYEAYAPHTLAPHSQPYQFH